MTDSSIGACCTCEFWKRGFRDESAPFPWVYTLRNSKTPNPRGRCRRDPDYVERHRDDWCGSYKTIGEAEK